MASPPGGALQLNLVSRNSHGADSLYQYDPRRGVGRQRRALTPVVRRIDPQGRHQGFGHRARFQQLQPKPSSRLG